MSPHDLSELRANESWQRVLAAYLSEQKVRRTVEPEHSGWVSRLKSVAGVDRDELHQIHGKLIAFGLLKFQLAGRSDGVQYQVSTFGKDELEQLQGQPAETTDDAAADAA